FVEAMEAGAVGGKACGAGGGGCLLFFTAPGRQSEVSDALSRAGRASSRSNSSTPAYRSPRNHEETTRSAKEPFNRINRITQDLQDEGTGQRQKQGLVGF